ncbi:hypothetical protein BDR05DRAFT_1004497 [Suillus weaverae]|nr:hypothetical protein BDR05DRAFT_1004497 [Suillus weaverae]
MPGSWEGQYIKLEPIRLNDLPLPSDRIPIPAGFYVSIIIDSRGCLKSPVRVVLSDEAELLGDVVTLSLRDVSEKVEIRVSYELGLMLGSGEVAFGEYPTSHSCTLLTSRRIVLPIRLWRDVTLSDSLVDCEIARNTDAGHVQSAEYVTGKTVSHLNAAVEHFQLVLDQCPVSHPDHATAPLTNVADRFDRQGKPNDLDEAISLYEEVLRLCPVGRESRDFSLDNLGLAPITPFKERGDIGSKPDSLRLKQLDDPERYTTLYNLSSALCSRFTQTRENGDIEEAIQLCQEALASLPSLYPGRCRIHAWLQMAYLSRYHLQHNPIDLSLATVAAEQHGHGSALEAYSTFFELLDVHLATRSSATSRHEAAAAFHYARSLPVDAASCAIRCDNPRHAVELVEQGRGQQWSLASRLRTPVEDLESANPKSAHNYLELKKCVSNAAQISATITDRAAVDRAATEHSRLTRQLEAAVAEIHNLRAFSRFLLSPSYEDLQVAAHHGPVIILIASQCSCSAIIVPTSGDPHHVPLPSVALTDLMTQGSLHQGNTTSISDEPSGVEDGSNSTLADRAVPGRASHLSYTPTLSALVRSRQMMKKRVPPSFVAIGQGQPGTGKGKALLAVDSELELVHKLVPATANCTTISGDAATRAGALQASEENTWVHLYMLAVHDIQTPNVRRPQTHVRQ